ncbi:unnamed protein product [Rangifer tarandus platyrhynchus]|uniref:Uncharacterized protein n=2 Tax=Rangifer tarandus platyrhynchus TaxID=3082113 RepID=A0ACB0FNN2_RANTA|nr:unnamed protein product [Rangifer tarandus platyrhynchus]CAI9713731.1 unnamed protein product [Rangifer tarandus platyrhynchus]
MGAGVELPPSSFLLQRPGPALSLTHVAYLLAVTRSVRRPWSCLRTTLDPPTASPASGPALCPERCPLPEDPRRPETDTISRPFSGLSPLCFSPSCFQPPAPRPSSSSVRCEETALSRVSNQPGWVRPVVPRP